ncbi:MAG: O-antigen ligase family protein [candidate division WOR-3 bacterium]|nr:MAG: O-antigen ligase family protein [candidate division WOR-3 bacterium]
MSNSRMLALGLRRGQITAFVLIELACAIGFAFALAYGKTVVAVSVLLVPLQVFIWAYLIREESRMAMAMVAVASLAAFGLLQREYVIFVFTPGSLALLAACRYPRFMPGSVGERGDAPRHVVIPIIALLTVVLLAAWNAYRKGWARPGLVRQTVTFVEVLGVTWFLFVLPRTIGQLRRLALTMTAIVVLSCLCLPIMPAPTGEGGILGGKIVRSIFGSINMNAYGSVIAASAAIVLGLALDSSAARAKSIALGTAFVVLVAALVVTKSRGAWLGLGLAYVYILFRKRSLKLVLGTAALALLLFSLDFFARIIAVRTTETSLRDPSLLGRFTLWSYAFKVARHNWLFGVGWDAFRYVKYLYGFPGARTYGFRYHTHNIFLELLTGLGLPGLVSFLWLWLGTLFGLDRVARNRSGRPTISYLALGLNAGLVAFLGHNLVDCVVWHYGTFLFLGAILGLSLAAGRVARACDPSPLPGPIQTGHARPRPGR